MTIVSVEELKQYMGNLTLTPVQETHVTEVILPGIQEDLEDYCNRPLEPVIVREGLRSDDRGFLWFRVTPIHSVTAIVRSDGSTVSPTTVPVAPTLSNPDELRVMDEWGVPDLFGYQLNEFSVGYSGYPLGTGRAYYIATYVAGYNGFLNKGLKLDMLRVAAREVEMQFDDTMSLRGGQTEAASDSDNRVKGWTLDEKIAWDRLRRRVSA